MTKKSAKELRDELRSLRKENQKPVSKLRITDVASEIERLKSKREETPAVAATPSEKSPKKMVAKITDMKEAKAAEFPVAPKEETKKKPAKVEAPKEAPKKMSKLDKLMKMLEEDSE